MKVALIMIVKNEVNIIERNLMSTLPLVDTFLIIDTGSDDNTVEKIYEVAAKYNKGGEVLHRPWVNFGFNRTQLLQEARSRCDFGLMIDADDFVSGTLPVLDAKCDGYSLQCEMNNVRFYRPHIFNSQCLWKYIGVIHEYASGGSLVVDNSLTVHARCEGVRSKNPNKYLDDALVLERLIHDEPDNNYARHVFYCAQSYKDAGQLDTAKRYFTLRTNLGGWSEEIYISYLNIIRMTHTPSEKISLAWKGITYNQDRKEIPFHILQWFRNQDMFTEEVFSMAFTYLENKESPTYLFLETNAYDWSYLDEFGLYAFYTNRKDLAKTIFRRCIVACPPEHVSRIQNNLQYV
jgi:glycosyltransferase involved in cell wall biosynthesis